MASTGNLLRVMYGSTSLPTTKLEGSMYVLVDNSSATNNVYSAGLYFDLDQKRYQINSAVAQSLANAVTLKLNGTQLGNSFNGSGAVEWNIPAANGSSVAAGLVTNGAQTFAGAKTFSGAATFSSTIAVKNTATMRAIVPETTTQYDLGSTSKVWSNVYATTFHGDLDGNATSATTANSVANQLRTKNIAGTITQRYDGSAVKEISLTDFVGSGETIPLSMIPAAALERIETYADQTAAQTALTNGDLQAGDLVHITGTGIMYYVKETISGGNSVLSLEEFKAGVATEAAQISGYLTLKLGTTTVVDKWKGATGAEFTVPFANGTTTAGIVSTTAQTFGGNKTFAGTVTLNSTLSVAGNATLNGTTTTHSVVPAATTTYNLGATDKQWSNVYATTFHGALDGTATVASSTSGKITFSTATLANATGITGSEFNGSGNVTVGVFKPSTASAGGSTGLVPAPASNDTAKVLRSNGYWASITGASGINVTSSSNDAFTIGHSNSISSATQGPSGNVEINPASGGQFVVPVIGYDAYGHITSGTTAQIKVTALTVTQHLSSGLKVATVGGTDIYAGVEWETF